MQQHGAQLTLDSLQLPPLTRQQVANLRLLSELHGRNRRYKEAAEVLIKLAERAGDAAEGEGGSAGGARGVPLPPVREGV